MSSDLVLSVRNVSKTYRVDGRPHHRVFQALSDRRGRGPTHCFEVPAVSDVSFDLGRNDGISIIGRNGSGEVDVAGDDDRHPSTVPAARSNEAGVSRRCSNSERDSIPTSPDARTSASPPRSRA